VAALGPGVYGVQGSFCQDRAAPTGKTGFRLCARWAMRPSWWRASEYSRSDPGSRTEVSRSRSIVSNSQIVASREAIRASRCSSHASRRATSGESFFVRVESGNLATLYAVIAPPSLKFPTILPKLPGL
jgi:hypothetical protein